MPVNEDRIKWLEIAVERLLDRVRELERRVPQEK